MPAAIALLSYLTATVAFLFLAVLLLFKWHARRNGTLLIVACIVTTLWAGANVYAISLGVPISWQTRTLEVLGNAAWSAFILALLNPGLSKDLLFGHLVNRAALLLGGFYLLLLAALAVAHNAKGAVATVAGLLNGGFGMPASAVIGMVLIEQLLRSASTKERWALKFACLGAGSFLAFDFYFYVDAMLFRRADAEIWACRGFVTALAAPMIAVSAARNPGWSASIAVSRRILFHSVTLIGASIYLLGVAGAGYYLRFFGGEWGTVLQLTFLFGAALLLFATLISGSFRSWLKVSISKHFYSYGYDYREEWLQFTRSLSGTGVKLGERAIEAIGNLVESSKGVLFVRDASGGYRYSAEWNMEFAGKHWQSDDDSDNRALCDFLLRTHWVIDIPECRADGEKYGGLHLPAWLDRLPDAWLIVPLMQDDDLFGFVVLGQSKTKLDVDWEIRDLLKIVGMQTASYLARQQAASELAVARQFETFNRMSTFVVHDLKNVVSQLALLTANAEKHKDSPEFQKDMLDTITHAVQKMRVLLQRFQRESSTEQSVQVSLNDIVHRAVEEKKDSTPRPTLEIGSAGLVVLADVGRLQRVMGHLLQNAIEATPRDGRVKVRLAAQTGNAVIEIIDTGRGMTQDFVSTRLFKPFESTKAAGMGIGVFETREYVQQLGGRLEVFSEEARGTTFKVTLPLYDVKEQRIFHAA